MHDSPAFWQACSMPTVARPWWTGSLLSASLAAPATDPWETCVPSCTPQATLWCPWFSHKPMNWAKPMVTKVRGKKHQQQPQWRIANNGEQCPHLISCSRASGAMPRGKTISFGWIWLTQALNYEWLYVMLCSSGQMNPDSSASCWECSMQTAARPPWIGSLLLVSPVAQVMVPWETPAPWCTPWATLRYQRFSNKPVPIATARGDKLSQEIHPYPLLTFNNLFNKSICLIKKDMCNNPNDCYSSL